jgi:hypothetical protein
MSWRLAKTLKVLLGEVNEHYPLRDKTSDGTLGNASHAAGTSDHNPDSRGVVCAVDIDEDLNRPAGAYPSFHDGMAAKKRLVDRLLALAKDDKLPQLYYVIYERMIFSRTYGFRPRTYSGPNAHEHHVHVSVYHPARLADSTKPWGIYEEDDMPTAKEVAAELAKNEAFLNAIGEAVWNADVIPNVWGDPKTNPNVRGKSALVEIGNDLTAVRARAETPQP